MTNTITDATIRDYLAWTLKDCAGGDQVDVAAAASDLIAEFGHVDMDKVDPRLFWAIVNRHDPLHPAAPSPSGPTSRSASSQC